MDENKLANDYLRAITKWADEHSTINSGEIIEVNQESIWELAKKLAKMAQPRKSYQDLYNSPEGRQERKKLSKK